MRHTRLALAAVLALAVVGSATGIVHAGEVGFIEDFAIKDREAALKQLIPGTEDYYYYHCLHYQNTGQLDKVDGGAANRQLTDTQVRDALAAGQLDKTGLLRPWIMRHGRTARVIEIENRQALLSYDKDPLGTLTFLHNRLNLTFNQQRQMLEQAAGLASKLDQALIPEWDGRCS